MKILYFHQHFSTPRGAAGTRSYEMARKLTSRGHSVTLVCGSYLGGNTGVETPFVAGKRSGFVDGIFVVEYDLLYSNSDGFLKRSLSFSKFVIKGSMLVLSERFDLLFATSTPLTVGLIGLCARWFRGKPFVFDVIEDRPT